MSANGIRVLSVFPAYNVGTTQMSQTMVSSHILGQCTYMHGFHIEEGRAFATLGMVPLDFCYFVCHSSILVAITFAPPHLRVSYTPLSIAIIVSK